MNENINLCEILKDVPVGTKLYSPMFGEVELIDIDENIIVKTERNSYYTLSYNGAYSNIYPDGECLLFPSKDQRDWSKFKVEPQKVKVTLHPFDRVLIRDLNGEEWRATLLTKVLKVSDGIRFVCLGTPWKRCIPYNKETAHLLGTTGHCTIDYEIEFSKEFKD